MFSFSRVQDFTQHVLIYVSTFQYLPMKSIRMSRHGQPDCSCCPCVHSVEVFRFQKWMALFQAASHKLSNVSEEQICGKEKLEHWTLIWKSIHPKLEGWNLHKFPASLATAETMALPLDPSENTAANETNMSHKPCLLAPHLIQPHQTTSGNAGRFFQLSYKCFSKSSEMLLKTHPRDQFQRAGQWRSSTWVPCCKLGSCSS